MEQNDPTPLKPIKISVNKPARDLPSVKVGFKLVRETTIVPLKASS